MIASAAASDWDDLAELIQTCKGQGVSQAAAYDSGAGSHSVALVSVQTGKLHDWNFDLPEEWQASDLESVDLVGCIDLETVTLDSCQYEAVDDAGILAEFRMDRVQYQLTITLVEASTGTVVDSTVLLGGQPEGCPASLDMTTTEHMALWLGGGKCFQAVR